MEKKEIEEMNRAWLAHLREIIAPQFKKNPPKKEEQDEKDEKDEKGIKSERVFIQWIEAIDVCYHP